MFSRLDIAQIGNFCAFVYRVKFSPCGTLYMMSCVRYWTNWDLEEDLDCSFSEQELYALS